MHNFIIIFLYIKDYNIRLIFNLKIVIITIILISILILYFLILVKMREELIKFLLKRNTNLYFNNYYDVMKSLLFMIFFTLYYIFYLRIMIFFSEKNFNINFYDLLNKIQVVIIDKPSKSLCLIVFSLIVIYITIFFIFYMIIFLAKKNYLKFHYYYLLRKNFYRNALEKIQDFELRISNFRFYNYFVFIKFHGFRIVIVILFFYCIFLDKGDISKILKILPYYTIYYFIFNIYNYIIYIFKYDFDVLVIESYYKSIHFLMEKSEYKKNEYIKFLLFNRSDYKFQDSIMLMYGLDKNVLVIEIYKYTNNKKPNDFFSIIEKKKPIFVQ